jgi:hypothetical protein
MRILAALAVLGLSTPATADNAACLAAPTQACVFDMALVAANQGEDLQRNVTDFLTIAAFQESAGDVQNSAATTELVISLIENREPDQGKRAGLLDWSATAVSDLIADAPTFASRMAAYLESDPDALKTRLKFAALAGDTNIVNTLLDAAPSFDRDSYILSAASYLMVRGDYFQAYEIGGRNRTAAFRALLDETAVTLLLRVKNLEAAEVVAAGMPEPAARAGAIIQVAAALAQTGEIAKAKAYGALAGELSGDHTSPYATLGRAGILALAGDSAGSQALLATITTSEMPPGGRETVRLLSAIMTGDKAEIESLIADFDRPNRASFAVKDAAFACLAAATCDVATVLVATEGPAQEGALNAIGLVQARAGKSADALATLEALRALGPEARVHGDFRSALVLLLASEGKVSLALDLAVEAGNARLLAELAAQL